MNREDDEESDWIFTAYSYKNHEKIKSEIGRIKGISEFIDNTDKRRKIVQNAAQVVKGSKNAAL